VGTRSRGSKYAVGAHTSQTLKTSCIYQFDAHFRFFVTATVGPHRLLSR